MTFNNFKTPRNTTTKIQRLSNWIKGRTNAIYKKGTLYIVDAICIFR